MAAFTTTARGLLIGGDDVNVPPFYDEAVGYSGSTRV
jgi:hypothetical protein